MVATPHILASVALSRFIKNPYLIPPVAILFHFLIDAIPHKDYRIFRKDVLFKKSLYLISLDNLIGFLAVFVIGYFLKWSFFDYELALISAFSGILPDIFQTLARIFFRENKIAIFYRGLHEKTHLIKIDDLKYGFFQQIAVAVIAIIVIMWI